MSRLRELYLAERKLLRQNPDREFTHDFQVFQALVATGRSKILKEITEPELAQDVEILMMENRLFYDFFLKCGESSYLQEVVQDFCQLDDGQKRDIAQQIVNSESLSSIDDSRYPENLQKWIRSSEILSRSREEINPDSTQISFDEMHWTFRKRQSDSNLLLRDLYQAENSSNSKNALFVGGSLGVTSLEFLATFKDLEDAKWNVISMDLFKPNDVFLRLKKRNEESGIPLFKEENFRGFSALNYVCADMQVMPFNGPIFDLIDACNVLGYVASYNRRLRIVKSLFELIKPGGYLRLVTPSAEGLFEQMVIQKLSNQGFDYEIIYVSLSGKALPRNAVPAELLKSGLVVTAQMNNIRHHIDHLKTQKNLSDTEKAVLADIEYLSPLTFGAGIYDDYRILKFEESQGYEYYVQDVKQALHSLCERIEKDAI
ncbi:MAG: class I SAM-dependent methyltransferase [Bdellovibrionales bacterium]|nr:class I SAM-dependent methyltransferase [Bdellovibrionales bacterium]